MYPLIALLVVFSQTHAEPYRAADVDPSWSLTFDGGTMTYQPADGPSPVGTAMTGESGTIQLRRTSAAYADEMGDLDD